jgi:CubicO group peptidase (beta-lactamase class C family)
MQNKLAHRQQAIRRQGQVKNLFLFITVSSIFFSSAALAQHKTAKVDPYLTSGGNAVEFPNKFLTSGRGVNKLRPFNAELQTGHDIKSAERAQKLMENNEQLLTVLLVNKGRIVFESYRSPAGPDSKMHSMSKSKSLTALVIGNLLCDGKIKSLGEKASLYAPHLEGSPYGDTTIYNLLRMASGIKKLGSYGQPKPKTYAKLKNQRKSGMWAITGHTRVHKQGTYHLYNSGDTLALSQVTQIFGGLIQNFDRYIWSRIGPEQDGAWMVDHKGQAIAFAGFNATLRDWGRLGMYTIDMVKGRGSPCIQKFVSAMTSKQIKNARRPGEAGRQFSHYGYQTWIKKNGDAHWVGYGGQAVKININSEKLMVVHSQSTGAGKEIHKTWRTFREDPASSAEKIKIKPISAKPKVENEVKTRLRKLKELEIEGLISKEEASTKRKKILDSL